MDWASAQPIQSSWSSLQRSRHEPPRCWQNKGGPDSHVASMHHTIPCWGGARWMCGLRASTPTDKRVCASVDSLKCISVPPFTWVVSCSKQGLNGNKTKLNEIDAVLFQTNPWVYSCIHRHVHIRLWTTFLTHFIYIHIYIYTCVSMKRWHQQLELLASLGHVTFSFDISFNAQVSSACAHNFVRPTTFRPTQQFQMASANTVFHRWHVPPYHFSF